MRHVLLVDDDTNFRRSLAIALEAMGYHVYEAKSGMEALRFLRDNQRAKDKVEGVVLDARMPGLDGFWLADQISEVYPSLKIVILSAHSYPLQSDQYTFLTKPVHIPDLIEVLEQDVSLIEKRETA